MLMWQFLLFFIAVSKSYAEDSEYLVKTSRLPADLNFMPTLGNGHLGYTVFGDAIFMNGVYNGRAGDSRRARIPNWLNVSVSGMGPEHGNAETLTTYEMHLKDGYFRWRQALPSGGVQLEQRSYAHRYYTRALVYELLVRRTEAEELLILTLTQNPGNNSVAFDFMPGNASSETVADCVGELQVLRGVTKVVEQEHFQPQRRTIFVVLSENLETQKTLEMIPGQKELYYRFILTADEQQDIAQREMREVLNVAPVELLHRHASQWNQFWLDQFNIEVKGNLELSRTVNAGIFYLASSLPAARSSQAHSAFYGLSPTGLGRGQSDDDYEGHNFWDTEIWMLPVVEQLSPAWAQSLLQYRLEHLPGAQYNARRTGYVGARFPWESAFTGTEVTNPCCPEVAAQEVHISADIAFALAAHYSISHDREWLCQTAWPLAREIATFLASRVEWNARTQRFHINIVMGPDEDHWNVSDNVYTNVVFKLSLEFASFARDSCEPQPRGDADAPSWQEIAQKLFILYDPKLDYHPQHAGYRRGEQVKQADVILLGYPLQFPMNVSTRLNDLNAYESVTRPSGPAMTWSLFALNFLDVAQVDKAGVYFEKGYQDYVRPQFKVWSETKLSYTGSANFLTGVGGFLQALINGYAGIRFRRVAQKSIMDIKERHLPPGSSEITIKGIKFASATFALKIRPNSDSTLTCLELGQNSLILIKGKEKLEIFKGFAIELKGDKVSLQTL